jgi:predicted ArsR family transcriptional regulator
MQMIWDNGRVPNIFNLVRLIMEKFVMKSAKQKILDYLSKTDGYNTLTVAQARARFGINNVAARIDELRSEGYSIYTNTRTLEDGRKIQFYRMGTPSKRVVAAGVQRLRDFGQKAFA